MEKLSRLPQLCEIQMVRDFDSSFRIDSCLHRKERYFDFEKIIYYCFSLLFSTTGDVNENGIKSEYF